MKGKVVGHPSRYYLDDGGIEGYRQVTKEEFDAALPSRSLEGGTPLGNTPGAWPMLSDALAVHPDQIAEVTARNKRHGLHIEYHPADGRPILMDRGMRRELIRVEGLVDKDGGYGD